MKKALFTPAEYRQLGPRRADLMAAVCKLRTVVGVAYGHRHPLFDTIVKAQESGVSSFFYQLEELAYIDHPNENFTKDFDAASDPNYSPPANLPGCTAEETALIEAALEKRRNRIDRKRVPLTASELRVIGKCLYAIDAICSGVLERIIDTYGENIPMPALDIFQPEWRIVDAFVAAKKEERRVIDEQK